MLTSQIKIELTGGNIRNNHFYLKSHLSFFPHDAIGGKNKQLAAQKNLTIEFPRGKQVETDIDGEKGILRNRSCTREFFEVQNLKEGDSIQITKLSDYRYRVEAA